MVHFEEQPDDTAADGVAPVAYLPGATPGMKRRSPLAPRTLDKTRFDRDPEELARETDVAAETGSNEPVSNTADFAGVADPEDLADATDDDETDSEHSDERVRAEKVLMHRLHGRSLSTKEAIEVLRGTDLSRDETEEVIARFTELHYIDEYKLAEQVLHSHGERKGLGRNGVGAELRRRGVSQEIIDATLEELPDDETERAIELATKRIGQMDRLDDQTIKRRLQAFLQRKGYNGDICRQAISAALDSRGGGGSSPVRFR